MDLTRKREHWSDMITFRGGGVQVMARVGLRMGDGHSEAEDGRL